MSEVRSIYVELHDGDRIVSGHGVIIPGADHERSAVEALLDDDEWDHVVIEVQHLTLMPRVKWCSRYDGFGCDGEGEWHAHYFRVKHNPASDCCHTVALPVWPTAARTEAT